MAMMYLLSLSPSDSIIAERSRRPQRALQILSDLWRIRILEARALICMTGSLAFSTEPVSAFLMPQASLEVMEMRAITTPSHLEYKHIKVGSCDQTPRRPLLFWRMDL